MADPSVPIPVAPAVDDEELQAAYESVYPEMMALRPEELQPINVEIPYAVAVALATAESLPPFMERIERLAHEVDVPRIKKLRTYALAASYAHGDHMFAITPVGEMPALHEEGIDLRERLLTSAVALSVSGLLPNDHVAPLKNAAGYRNLGQYLIGLSKLFKDYWETIANKTPITLEQVNRAGILGIQLLRGAGIKLREPMAENEAAQIRQRAFTLLARAHTEVRTVMSLIRHKEGDVDRFAMSIFTNRNNGGSRGKAPETEPETEPDPAPEPSPSDPQDPVALPDAPSVPIGHRGAPPFFRNNS